VSHYFEEALTLKGEAETIALGQRLSLWARQGMLIKLHGDLGSGKSTFARAFIRSLMKIDFDVPSPTFSLVQTYDETRVPVFHADLYRLEDASEAEELGLESLLSTRLGLVEWAERLPGLRCADVLTLELGGRGESRTLKLEAQGAWAQALQRDAALRAFVSRTDFASAQRSFFEGDASSRRYEMLTHANGETALLMDMPRRPDGPPVKDGKPYSQIAHLAESISAVVAVNTHLVSQGYSAPRVLESDLVAGFGIIEPLGSNVYGHMMREGLDMREPMEEAVNALADMAGKDWPRHPEAAPGECHTVHDYDTQAQLIEVDLLPAWYIPHVTGAEAAQEQRQQFACIWEKLLPLAQTGKLQWVLRDFHSPNLIWIPGRKGLARVGIIDTQDAVMGHPAYDLVSMGQDARIDIPPEMETHLMEHYCKKRAQHGGFDAGDFKTAYAVLGAQRATKILGIFARLNKRDGKPAYLRHMPRVKRHLARNLQHPALAELRDWYGQHLPDVFP
jgi:N-acetylmuramate 1-kinase